MGTGNTGMGTGAGTGAGMGSGNTGMGGSHTGMGGGQSGVGGGSAANRVDTPSETTKDKVLTPNSASVLELSSVAAMQMSTG